VKTHYELLSPSVASFSRLLFEPPAQAGKHFRRVAGS
jgi:hypothetical protein